MHELQPGIGSGHGSTRSTVDSPSVSLPERELLGFIHSVRDLVGTGETCLLTELWLDELASMARTPEPTSPEWRLVSLGASARLARHLIEMHDQEAYL
jgi:hypothetical protein